MGHRPILLSHIKSFQYSGCSPKYSNEKRLSQAEIQLFFFTFDMFKKQWFDAENRYIDADIQLSRKKSFHFQYFGC